MATDTTGGEGEDRNAEVDLEGTRVQEELPENVVSITDVLRIHHDARLKCRHQRFEIDARNKIVTCSDCHAEVSAYDALVTLAHQSSLFQSKNTAMLAQYRALKAWQPRLRVLRDLERIWRGKMLPSCPHCHRGLLLEDFEHPGMVGREFELQQRKPKI